MWLRYCHAEAKASHAKPGTYRKSRHKVACIGAHIGARFVAIAQAYVHSFGGRIFAGYGNVAHKIASERILANKIGAAAVVRCRCIVWQSPLSEVGKRDREAERRIVETLGEAHLHVPGQFVVVVGKFLHPDF